MDSSMQKQCHIEARHPNIETLHQKLFAHRRYSNLRLCKKAAQTVPWWRSEEAEEAPNEGLEWREAPVDQFARKARTGERVEHRKRCWRRQEKRKMLAHGHQTGNLIGHHNLISLSITSNDPSPSGGTPLR
jgi:hypothetical protein